MISLKEYKEQKRNLLQGKPENTGDDLASQMASSHNRLKSMLELDKASEKRKEVALQDQHDEDQRAQVKLQSGIQDVDTSVDEGTSRLAKILKGSSTEQIKLLREILRNTKIMANGGQSGGLLDTVIDVAKGALLKKTASAGTATIKTAGNVVQKGFFCRMSDALKEGGGRFSKLPDKVLSVRSAAASGIESATGKAKLLAEGTVTAAKSAATRVSTAAAPLVERITPTFDKAKSVVSDAVSAAKTSTAPLVDKAKYVVSDAVSAAKTSTAPLVDKVAATAVSATDKVKSVIGQFTAPAGKQFLEPAAGKSLTTKAAEYVGSMKGANVLGNVLSLGTAAYDTYKVANNDNLSTGEKSKEISKIGAGTAGSLAGAELGAAAGTAVLPGIGTVVGGIVGGIGGYAVGSGAADYVADGLNKAVESAGLGDLIGKSVAVAMTPFSANARQAVSDDWNANVKPSLDAVSTKFQETGAKITTGMNGLGDTLSSTIGSWLSNVKKFFGASDVIDTFTSGVKDLTTELEQQKDSAKLATGSIWSSLKEAGSTAVGGAKSAYSELKQGNVQGAISAAVDTSRKAVGQLVTDASISKGIAVGRWTPEETAVMQSAQAAGEKFRAGSGLTEGTKQLVADLSKKHGVDPNHIMSMIQMESGGNAKAVSATGAAGLMQFTGGTAKQYGITNRFDPTQNIEAGIRLYKDNKSYLEKNGIAPTLDNLYIAHQQGAGGATQILKAAEGKGSISAEVQKNIGLNVGGNTGSIQGFLQANKKALAAASVKAASVTLPDQPQSSPKVGPASVTLASAGPAQQPAQQSRVLDVSPSAIVSKTEPAPIPKLSPTVPAETQKVTVVNQVKDKDTGRSQASPTQPTQVASVQSRGTPKLNEIPSFVADESMMGFALGMV